MTKDEALMMVIKAEETGNLQDLVDAVNACKEALQQEALATNKESLTVQPAETNEQEPIAWMNDIAFSMEKELLGTRSRIVGLYARPLEWKGLTKQEIIQADNATNDLHAFAYAINAKLKEKNTS